MGVDEIVGERTIDLLESSLSPRRANSERCAHDVTEAVSHLATLSFVGDSLFLKANKHMWRHWRQVVVMQRPNQETL
jgi:hypothetical protein